MAAIQDFGCSFSVPRCAARMISLSSSWKIHVERYELKMTGVLFYVRLQCSCVLFTGEAMLCHGPG